MMVAVKVLAEIVDDDGENACKICTIVQNRNDGVIFGKKNEEK